MRKWERGWGAGHGIKVLLVDRTKDTVDEETVLIFQYFSPMSGFNGTDGCL